MKKVIVFGISKIADVLYETIETDENADMQICAFCVDKRFRNVDEKYGLPVVDFESIEDKYSPDQYEMVIAIGYHKMNSIREEKCGEAKKKGYSLANYVYSNVVVSDDVCLGKNILIFNDVCIGPGCEIGDDTVIFSGAIISHHTKIGKHNWITSGTVIGGNSIVGNNCFLGICSTVGHNTRIGNMNFIGANALITKDTDNNGVYIMPDTPRYRLETDKFMQLFRFE